MRVMRPLSGSCPERGFSQPEHHLFSMSTTLRQTDRLDNGPYHAITQRLVDEKMEK